METTIYKKEIKKIKPPKNVKEYHKARCEIALNFAPRICPCKKCGWPVADGYCCITCGDTSPYET